MAIIHPVGSAAPRPRLIKPQRQQLGDMLQRLALIAPDDLFALTMITRDVLKHAEARYKRYFPDPTKYDGPRRH